MTTKELEEHFARHREGIRAKLLAGRWTPSPVKRVEIPKPGGGVRKLGIPTVMDRLIQQALLQVMGPIFEQRFSESSYGFRAGRSAHEAVRKAQEYVQSGKDSRGRYRHREILRSGQPRLVDGTDRASDTGQASAAVDRALLAGRRRGGGRVGTERGGDSARRTVDSSNAKGNFVFDRELRYR